MDSTECDNDDIEGKYPSDALDDPLVAMNEQGGRPNTVPQCV